jgi:hypothetical protein
MSSVFRMGRDGTNAWRILSSVRRSKRVNERGRVDRGKSESKTVREEEEDREEAREREVTER